MIAAGVLQVVLGVLCFAFFQISGGNPLFVEFPEGLSTMARLAFGFVSYQEFYNDGTGMESSRAQG